MQRYAPLDWLPGECSKSIRAEEVRGRFELGQNPVLRALVSDKPSFKRNRQMSVADFECDA
jgi:hypothetical protein